LNFSLYFTYGGHVAWKVTEENHLMIGEFDGEYFIFWKDRVERIKQKQYD